MLPVAKAFTMEAAGLAEQAPQARPTPTWQKGFQPVGGEWSQVPGSQFWQQEEQAVSEGRAKASEGISLGQGPGPASLTRSSWLLLPSGQQRPAWPHMLCPFPSFHAELGVRARRPAVSWQELPRRDTVREGGALRGQGICTCPMSEAPGWGPEADGKGHPKQRGQQW